MKKDGYQTLDEWKIDLEKVKSNPNNKQLLMHVKDRVDASSSDLKKQVKQYLEEAALETRPWQVLKAIAKEMPNHIVFAKSDEDPWFEA